MTQKSVLEKNEIINVFDQKTWSQLSSEKYFALDRRLS